MSNKAKSVYLTPRSMSALRPGDALSGRVNEIIDRYLSMIEEEKKYVRDQFGPLSWPALVTAYGDNSRLSITECRDALSAALHGDTIETMTSGEVVVLVELIEGDRIAAAVEG